MDWLGWDSLSFGEQAAVAWYTTAFSGGALGLVLLARVLFGGLRLKRAKAKRKRKAKARKRGRG